MAKTTLLFALIIAALSLHSTAQTDKAQAPAVSTAPVNVVLADATPIKLRLGATAGTNGVRVGENVDLEVVEDVRIGDVVVIAKGSPASASVTNLRSGVSAGRGGWIDVNLESVNLADGQHVPIRASRIKPVRNDQSMIVSSSGQDASIAPGTNLTTYINGDQPLDLTRIRAAGGPAARNQSYFPPVQRRSHGRRTRRWQHTLHPTPGRGRSCDRRTNVWISALAEQASCGRRARRCKCRPVEAGWHRSNAFQQATAPFWATSRAQPVLGNLRCRPPP